MKNFVKWFGLVALVAIIGLSMAACDDGSGGPGGVGGSSGGTFTITGIPSKYNGKYAMAVLEGNVVGQLNSHVLGYQTYNKGDYTFSRIQNGTLSLPIWLMGTSGGTNRYTGNDTFDVAVTISSAEKLHDTNSSNNLARVDFMSVKFSNGNASRSWNSGEVLERK